MAISDFGFRISGYKRRAPKSEIGNPKSGFTLLELICVIVIISVIMALAAVRVDALLPKYRLRGAAREVAAAIKQARTRAATTGKEVYLQYDLPKGEFWLLVAFPMPKDPNAPPDAPDLFQYEILTKHRLAEGIDFVDVILGDKQKYTEGQPLIRVSPFGLSNNHIVNLRNKDGMEIALKINGITGAVTYFDHHKDADELLRDEGP